MDLQSVINEMLYPKRETNTLTLTEEKELLSETLEQIINHWGIDMSSYSSNKEFIRHVTNEVLGCSVLMEAFENENISEIHCQDWNDIWVEMNGVTKVKYPHIFKDRKHYERVIKRLAEYGGIETKSPNSRAGGIAEFKYDNHRIVVNSHNNQLTMSIRKNSDNSFKLTELIENGLMDDKVARLLKHIIRGEANVIFGGSSSTGKTTTMNALLNEYLTKGSIRFHLVEGSKEMSLNHPTINTHLFGDYNNGEELFKYIYKTMPDRIVVDEAHHQDFGLLVEGMLTGHATQAIVHGNSAKSTLDRLLSGCLNHTENPAEDRPNVIDSIQHVVDFIIMQEVLSTGDKKITSINEVVQCNESQQLELRPIMEYNPLTDRFSFVNTLTPQTINKMIRKGVSYEDLSEFI